jgi:hypothetical protein
MTITASDAALRIDWVLAQVAWRELRRRAGGVRESGAFLLASASAPSMADGAAVVRRAVYYDDLDPRCLTGGISLAGTAYDRLWRMCDADHLSVVADVHTHPEGWVGQSPMDTRNPMIGSRGHLAIIVPNFASSKCAIEGMGIYRYAGNHEWTTLDPRTAIDVQLLPGAPAETVRALTTAARHHVRRRNRRREAQ